MTRSFRSLSGVVVLAMLGFAAGCATGDTDVPASGDTGEGTNDVVSTPSPSDTVDVKAGNGRHIQHQDDIAHAPIRNPSISTGPLHLPSVPVVLPAAQVEYATNSSVEARILVLAGDGTEVDLPAIKDTLDHMGAPYDVVVTSQLAADASLNLQFAAGQGKYQGLILTTAALAYSPDGGTTWLSGLSTAQWQELVNYEAAYGVRQATWYTYPTADLGFAAAVGATGGATHGSFTTVGASVFSYVNSASGTEISNAYTYLAKAGAPADGTATPLIVDASGNALALLRKWNDGRENLALTFDSNQYLVHNKHVGYGVVNWVTRGVFVGEHKVYMSAQVDDLFIDDDEYPTLDTSSDGQGCVPSATQQCLSYRITGSDLSSIVTWQNNLRKKPTTAAFRMDLAFNGIGSTAGYFSNDTLTPKAKSLQANFKWISHTWDHELLEDTLVEGPFTYEHASSEFSQNNAQATTLGLSLFSRQNIVTPELSGSQNANVMQAMFDTGVRYMIADTSKPWIFGTAEPNEATYNALQPSIMMIPRRPTNVYYNVTTQSEWVDEFNKFYAPGGIFCAPIHPETECFAAPVTYAQLLDMESNRLLGYLLSGEAYPWMFHESNLRWNGKQGSLLTSVIDAAMTKYNKLFKLPVVSPTMDALGKSIAERMTYKRAGVRVTIKGNSQITISTEGAATVPITGLQRTGSEVYGGQYITRVALSAGGSVTYPITIK